MRTTLKRVGTALIVACAARASAQRTQGAVSVVGGSATDVLGTTSRAITVVPSLSIVPDSRLVLGVEASGTKFDNRQWAAGVGASADARVPLGHNAAIALQSAANGTGTSYDFSYATANVLPSLELGVGALSGFVGVRGAIAATRSMRTVEQPIFPFGAPPVASRSAFSVTRRARSLVYGASGRLVGAGGERLLIGVREERGETDTVPTTDRSVSASASVLEGRVTIGGTVGARLEPGSSSTFGNGMMSVVMTPVVSLEMNAGAYPASRLIGTPAGRFINVGLSVRTRRGAGERNGPSVRGVPAPALGLTRLALRAGGAERVDLMGDFTNWKPIAATRAPSGGVWFVDLRIPPGQYRYAFRIDGSTWKIPDGAAAVDDGFGGKSAWLTVSDPPSSTAR